MDQESENGVGELCTWGLPEYYSLGTGQDCSHLMAQPMKDLLPKSLLGQLASIRRSTSKLTHMTILPSCLTTWQLASSRISAQARVRENTQHGSHNPFHNLILEMTSYHSLLYSICLMQRFSALTPLTFWVGLFLAVRAVLCIIEC